MSLREVKKKCAELNRIYFSGKCLEKLERPDLIIENNHIETFQFKGKIKSKQNILNIDSVLYKIIELDDSNQELNTKEEYGSIISRSEPVESNGDYLILFENSSPLKDSTNYKISIKLNTEISSYSSPFSASVKIKTKCKLKTYEECSSNCSSGNCGPTDFRSEVYINDKDPTVSKWPYFKVPNIVPIENQLPAENTTACK